MVKHLTSDGLLTMSAEFHALHKDGNVRAVALVTSNTYDRLWDADLRHKPKGSLVDYLTSSNPS